MIGKKFSKDSLAIECNTRNVIEFGIFVVEKKTLILKKRNNFGQVWEGEMCPQCVTHEQPKWKKKPLMHCKTFPASVAPNVR